MKTTLCNLAVAGVCVLAFGLAGCGGDGETASGTPSGDAAASASEKAGADKKADKKAGKKGENKGDKKGNKKGDVVAFEGDWKVLPKQPSSYTVLTIDAEGNVSAEETMVNPAWKGTIKPAGNSRYAVELTSDAKDNPRWFFTLAPDKTNSDQWIVFNEDGSEYGTFVRAD